MLLIGGVSIGMMIFNSANGLISAGISVMNQQEKDQFNNRFIAYVGDQVSRATVWELIKTVKSYNRQMEQEGTTERCVSIKEKNIIYKDTTQLENLRLKKFGISYEEKYKISASINDKTGLIDEITIDEITIEKINNN